MKARTFLLLLLGLGVVAGCDDDDLPGFGPGPRFFPTTASLLSTGNPFKDEDPSVIRAHDGSMVVAFFSDRSDGAGDIFIMRNPEAEKWSDPKRVTFAPEGDFYPTIFQDASGLYHLVWHRWYDFFRGHIMHSTSPSGFEWIVANEESVTTTPDVDDWLPTPVIDKDGTMFIYFVSEIRDFSNPTSDIYVVFKFNSGTDTGWSAPAAVATLNSATEHDQLPFVARTGNTLTMVWVRHDTSEPLPWLNPKSNLFISTSNDGVAWTPPLQVTNDVGNVVHLFPSIYSTGSDQRILWLSTRGGPARPYELPLAKVGQYPAEAVEVAILPDGYSHRVAPTPTPGVYLGVWVQGPEGTQDVFYRFFER